MLTLLLKIAGILLIGLSLIHAFFSRRFAWAEELPRLSLLNRQIFQVHCFFIALTVGLMGVLLFGWTDALVTRSPLAKAIAGGLTIFWSCRLVFQWTVYDSSLWRGRRFETAMHWLFTTLWLFLTAVFGWTFAVQCS
jgi:hypothetical protein